MTAANEKLRLRIYLGIFIVVMLLGTGGFMLAEDLSLGDAVYFTIVTIATVGYGDISPATPLGRGLAILLIVTGVGTFLGVVANATEIFLDRRDREARMQKLNMIIGLFFSELGTRLLTLCSRADAAPETLSRSLTIGNSWTAAEFLRGKNTLQSHPFALVSARIDFDHLSSLLNQQGDLLVRLLESPYMLEHETFTDLLIATLHLKEELRHRHHLSDLPQSDREHLAGDIERVYALLAQQWLAYVQHLQTHYPFLFSLALRTNPFDPSASPVVR